MGRVKQFIDKVADTFGYVKNVSVSSASTFEYDISADAKTEDFVKHYKSWVFGCVKARATDVSSIGLNLMKVTNSKTGEVERVQEHELLSLLYNVNPYMTFRELIYNTQAYKDLAGEAFWYLVRGGNEGNGPITAIIPLRPDWIEIVPDKQEFIKGYIYRIPGTHDPIKIPKEAIIHFKTFNPTDPYRGYSVLKAAANTIDTDNYAEDYNRKFFKNSAIPDAILTTEQKLTDAQHKQIKSEWNNAYQGVGKAHRTAILQGGIDLKPFAISQKDMEWLKGQGFNRDKILALFQTPKTVLGMTEDVTVSNAEATDRIFAKRVVKPLQEEIRDTLNEFLIPLFDLKSSDYFFTIDDPVPEDREAKREDIKTLFSVGAVSPNEIRAMYDMDEVEGLDSYYLPLNVQEVGSEEEPAKTPKKVLRAKIPHKTPKDKFAEKIKNDIMSSIADPLAKYLIGQTGNKYSDPKTKDADTQVRIPYAEREAFWKQGVDKSERNEVEYANLLKSIFNKQEEGVLERFNQIEQGKAINKISRNDIDTIIFDLKTQNEISIDILLPVLMKYLEEAGEDALDFLGIDDEPFDSLAESVKEFRTKDALLGIRNMNKTTRAKLRKVLSEAVVQGYSATETAKNIKSVFVQANSVRSLIIARTEVIKASNRGTLSAYKQSGVVVGKEWFTALDERVCPMCNPLHEKVVSLDKDFFTKGETQVGADGKDYVVDYENVGTPPRHPNCRCTLIPVTISQRGTSTYNAKINRNSKHDDGFTPEMQERVDRAVEAKIDALLDTEVDITI